MNRRNKRLHEMTDAELNAAALGEDIELTDEEAAAWAARDFQLLLEEIETLQADEEFAMATTGFTRSGLRLDDDKWITMPRNASDRITDRIYCGGDDYLYDHREFDNLKAAGITHVIDCRAEWNRYAWFRDSVGRQQEAEQRRAYFKTLINGCQDDYKPKSVGYFKRTLDFAMKALRDPNAKIYIHCAAGINRGPSNAYAVLRAMGLTAVEAEQVLRSNRPGVHIAYREDAERAVLTLGLAS